MANFLFKVRMKCVLLNILFIQDKKKNIEREKKVKCSWMYIHIHTYILYIYKLKYTFSLKNAKAQSAFEITLKI